MNQPLVLLADIGGTNARFALADTQRQAPLLIDSVRQFEVAQFPSLAEAAHHYLQAHAPGSQPRSGVFAVAGRIDGDEVRITNHHWVISRAATQQALGLDHLRLVNDFAAQAMAVELLTADDLVAIGDATWSPSATGERTFAVVGPGTGLGVSALLVRGDSALRPGDRRRSYRLRRHLAAGNHHSGNSFAALWKRVQRAIDQRRRAGQYPSRALRDRR